MEFIKRPRGRRAGERGQVLVIVAGGATVLLLLVGLVLDGGIAFFNRRDAQNTSDVAAMAGTALVADGYTKSATPGTNIKTQAEIHDKIEQSVTENNCTAGAAVPCTWTASFVGGSASDLGPVNDAASPLPNGALGVKVAVNRQPGTFLARLAMINQWNVTTEATAIATKPANAPPGQLLPIALKNAPDPNQFKPGQVYDLTDGRDVPGGFGWLAWEGDNDPNALADSLCDPDNPAFSFPTSFPGGPGKMNSSSVRACLDKWIANQQTVLIPIYDVVTGNGNSQSYRIVGVAAFVLTSHSQPAVDNIQGYFVNVYPFASVPEGAWGPPSKDDTTYWLGIVK